MSKWVAHNGREPIATMPLPPSQDISENNNFALVFNQIDQFLHIRLKYICLSPETQPKGFDYEAVW